MSTGCTSRGVRGQSFVLLVQTEPSMDGQTDGKYHQLTGGRAGTAHRHKDILHLHPQEFNEKLSREQLGDEVGRGLLYRNSLVGIAALPLSGTYAYTEQCVAR